MFAEVKTTRAPASAAAAGTWCAPLERLHPRQRARLRRQAVAWLCDRARSRPSARAVRLDAVGVTVDAEGRLLRLEHVEAGW